MNDQLKSSVRANRLLSGCKGLARPAQDRMIRTEETERRQPKPMGKRLKARALAALALALIGLGANAAPVVGTLNTIGLTGLNTAITWTPTNDPIYTDQGFIAGPAVTLYTTNPSAGSFSNVFAPGPYVVSFPLISWRRAFEVIVPPGTNLVQFTNTFLFPRYFVDAAALQSQINLMLQNGYATNGSGGGVTNNQVLNGTNFAQFMVFTNSPGYGLGNALSINHYAMWNYGADGIQFYTTNSEFILTSNAMVFSLGNSGVPPTNLMLNASGLALWTGVFSGNGSGLSNITANVTNNQVLPGIPLTTNGIFAGAFSGSGNSLQIDTAARTSHRYPQLLYRGIDSFYANVTGGPTNHMAREFWCLQQATNFITSGLASYGWNAIRIGPGWWWGRDPVTGSIQYNTNFFPDGMQVTISNLHALGMKVVLYYDNGQINNSGSLYPTNYPFNSDYSVSSVQASNDCVTFKNWKIDALAWDDGGIGGTSDAITRANIEQWSWWLKSIAPEISFISFGSGITNYDWVVTTPSNIGNAWHGVTYANAHKLPNWRVNASDQTAFFMDNWAGQSQGATLCEEIAWADKAAQYKSLEMGSIWNEGQYPWDPAAAGGTNYALGKIAVTFWSLFHSPYLLSGNGAFAYSFELPFLTNSTLLNLQTDPAQNRPVKVFDNGIGGAAWAETLNNGSVALAFLNYSNGMQQIVTLPLSSLGLGTNVSYTAYDAWGKTNFTVSNTYTWNCTNYYYNADLLILSVPAASSGLTAAQTAAQIASSNLVTAAMMATQIASSNYLAAPGGVGSFNGGSLTNVLGQTRIVPTNAYFIFLGDSQFDYTGRGGVAITVNAPNASTFVTNLTTYWPLVGDTISGTGISGTVTITNIFYGTNFQISVPTTAPISSGTVTLLEPTNMLLPSMILAKPQFTGCAFTNFGSSGTVITNFTYPSTTYNQWTNVAAVQIAAGKKVYVVDEVGENDNRNYLSYPYTPTGWSLITNQSTLISQITNAGCVPIICTILPSFDTTWAGFNSGWSAVRFNAVKTRFYFNNWERQNDTVTSAGGGCVDAEKLFSNLIEMAPDSGSATNAFFYFRDAFVLSPGSNPDVSFLHLNQIGKDLYASAFESAFINKFPVSIYPQPPEDLPWLQTRLGMQVVPQPNLNTNAVFSVDLNGYTTLSQLKITTAGNPVLNFYNSSAGTSNGIITGMVQMIPTNGVAALSTFSYGTGPGSQSVGGQIQGLWTMPNATDQLNIIGNLNLSSSSQSISLQGSSFLSFGGDKIWRDRDGPLYVSTTYGFMVGGETDPGAGNIRATNNIYVGGGTGGTGKFIGNGNGVTNLQGATVSTAGPLMTTNPVTGGLVPTYNAGSLTNLTSLTVSNASGWLVLNGSSTATAAGWASLSFMTTNASQFYISNQNSGENFVFYGAANFTNPGAVHVMCKTGDNVMLTNIYGSGFKLLGSWYDAIK